MRRSQARRFQRNGKKGGVRMVWRQQLGLYASIAICGLLAVLYVADGYFDDMSETRAEQDVVTVKDALNAQLQRYQDATQAVETLGILDEPAATRSIRGETQAAIDTLRSFLAADSLFVMDEHGTQIAGSGAVSVGQNYSFRPYFQKAIAGSRYVYPGIGKNLRTPRMFFSAPHYSPRSSAPTGIVGLSVGMDKIAGLLKASDPGTILGLMTEDGVVFAASSPACLYKTVLPVSAARLDEIRQARQFGDEQLDTAGFLVDRKRVVLDNTRYIVTRGRLNETNVEYFSLHPENRGAYFGFMGAVGFVYLLIASLAFRLAATLKQLRAQQRVLHETNASLLESQRALKHQATHDPLTDLLNRRGVMELLRGELARSGRYAQRLALGMCDIDHFKAINDTWGHGTGDEVLCALAGILKTGAREYDLVARLGGEEFLLAIPFTPGNDDDSVFERICRQVADTRIATKSGALSITISIGVTYASPGKTIEELIDEADSALYRAKAAGRNRVVRVFDPASQSPDASSAPRAGVGR